MHYLPFHIVKYDVFKFTKWTSESSWKSCGKPRFFVFILNSMTTQLIFKQKINEVKALAQFLLDPMHIATDLLGLIITPLFLRYLDNAHKFWFNLHLMCKL